jgi:Tol biopolymer transport system component
VGIFGFVDILSHTILIRFGILLSSLIFLTTAAAEEWSFVKLVDDPSHFGPGGMTADGTKIVFSKHTDGSYATHWDEEVFLMDLETKQVTRVTRNIYFDSYPTISPEGSKIAFVESERLQF